MLNTVCLIEPYTHVPWVHWTKHAFSIEGAVVEKVMKKACSWQEGANTAVATHLLDV